MNAKFFRKKIGTTISEARKMKSWTQEDLANRISFSNETIKNIEEGKLAANLDQLFLIFNELNLQFKLGDTLV